mmetsp:Transcript_22496/g.73085  ORF Transcript_22496/g.73085 Transcript_22496/m.73085 type:complete len:245 (-) Transcript_22496:470-1204(-)
MVATVCQGWSEAKRRYCITSSRVSSLGERETESLGSCSKPSAQSARCMPRTSSATGGWRSPRCCARRWWKAHVAAPPRAPSNRSSALTCPSVHAEMTTTALSAARTASSAAARRFGGSPPPPPLRSFAACRARASRVISSVAKPGAGAARVSKKRLSCLGSSPGRSPATATLTGLRSLIVPLWQQSKKATSSTPAGTRSNTSARSSSSTTPRFALQSISVVHSASSKPSSSSPFVSGTCVPCPL